MGRKVFLVSVTSSIIASVAFAWLLDPVTRWIWHTASDSAWSWFVNLQAAAFRNAALGKREWLSTALFIYVFTLVVMVLYTSPIGIGCGVLFGRLLRQKATDRTRQLIRGRVAPLTLVILSILMALSLTYVFGKIAFLAYVEYCGAIEHETSDCPYRGKVPYGRKGDFSWRIEGGKMLFD
ncbi:MAG: hypothetical protein DME90_05300 [Verrucomicrobia bacterium]|nr:MAG: hypothetical protein DME90_05300 [Verrucomicrobiota bacterium]